MKYRVNINAANEAKSGLSQIIDGKDSRILNRVGAFASLFRIDLARYREPILVLNGEGQGPINNLCVPSDVSSSYAPHGRSLVSVSVVADQLIPESDVRSQLRDWYGDAATGWSHLRRYAIPYALPAMLPGNLASIQQPDTTSRPKLFVCGDHRDTASIQGAMLSGRRAAEAALAVLGSKTSD